MKPSLGNTEAGKDLTIDVPKLLATRMLLDAESGGGKTVALTSNGDLHAAWMHILPRPQWSILASLIAIYPGDLDKDGLAKEAGASPTSSAYMNNLGSLRSLGVVDYPERGRVRATDMLFPFGN